MGCQAADSRGKGEILPAAEGVAPTSFSGGRVGMKVLGKVKILTQKLQELSASLMDDCRALIARAAKFFGTSKPK